MRKHLTVLSLQREHSQVNCLVILRKIARDKLLQKIFVYEVVISSP